jgi:hypothetical protein
MDHTMGVTLALIGSCQGHALAKKNPSHRRLGRFERYAGVKSPDMPTDMGPIRTDEEIRIRRAGSIAGSTAACLGFVE